MSVTTATDMETLYRVQHSGAADCTCSDGMLSGC
jgi:hypothetical protein